MKTIADVCKNHRTKTYFTLPGWSGAIGIFNHAGRVLWYTPTVAGWSLSGQSAKLCETAIEQKIGGN